MASYNRKNTTKPSGGKNRNVTPSLRAKPKRKTPPKAKAKPAENRTKEGWMDIFRQAAPKSISQRKRKIDSTVKKAMGKTKK